MRVGTIAQLVEQRTFNPFVVGSTPAGPTKIYNENKDLEKSKSFFLAQKQSSPVSSLTGMKNAHHLLRFPRFELGSRKSSRCQKQKFFRFFTMIEAKAS